MMRSSLFLLRRSTSDSQFGNSGTKALRTPMQMDVETVQATPALAAHLQTSPPVVINPESKSRQTNRELLNELIKLHGKTALGGKLPAYDGRKSLYTAGSLPFESKEFVVMPVDPEKKKKERAEREYKITIRIAGRTDLYHLQQFLRGRQRDMPQETIQVLDVVLSESPSWKGDIGEGLECWRGYYQSLRPTQMGLSLNIDISATSFFKPVSVIKFVEEYLNMRDTSRPLSDRDRVKIKKALHGVCIETTQQDQIRRYKITGVTSIPMSQLIFPVDDKGTRKTVVRYFWDKYNYSLEYSSWPCLQAGSDSRPVYLPMEVWKTIEGQRYSKNLNDRQVTNILRATCKRPQEREQSIRDMVLHNKYADDRFAQEFGIKVSSDLMPVPASVLPPPLLKYHDSGREKTCAPSVGQWNMINKKPQVSKYYFKKKTSSSHSRNGKDDANHDSRIQPRSPLSRQSLIFDATPTYHAGAFYEIDHDKLPPKSPIHLKSIRVVKVSECTNLGITVKFPSLQALRSFFSSYPAPGTGPELDERFVMSSNHAARILRRRVAEEELEGEVQQDSFWLIKPRLYDFAAPQQVPQRKPDGVSRERRNFCLLMVLLISILSSIGSTKAEVFDAQYCSTYTTRVVGYCSTLNIGRDCCATITGLLDMDPSKSCICPVLNSEAAENIGLTMETLIETYVGCNATQPVEKFRDICTGSHNESSSELSPPPVNPPPPANQKSTTQVKAHDRLPKKIIVLIFVLWAFVIIATGFLFAELWRKKEDLHYDEVPQDIELGAPYQTLAPNPKFRENLELEAEKAKAWSNALKAKGGIKKKRNRRPPTGPDVPPRRSERLKKGKEGN